MCSRSGNAETITCVTFGGVRQVRLDESSPVSTAGKRAGRNHAQPNDFRWLRQSCSMRSRTISPHTRAAKLIRNTTGDGVRRKKWKINRVPTDFSAHMRSEMNSKSDRFCEKTRSVRFDAHMRSDRNVEISNAAGGQRERSGGASCG